MVEVDTEDDGPLVRRRDRSSDRVKGSTPRVCRRQENLGDGGERES